MFCVDLDDTCKRAFTGSGDRVRIGISHVECLSLDYVVNTVFAGCVVIGHNSNMRHLGAYKYPTFLSDGRYPAVKF